jgi:hypothetical protein
LPPEGHERLQGPSYPAAATLDDIVLSNLKQRLFTPERLASMLQMLADRQSAKTDAVDRRLLSLQREVTDTDERLRRLYRSIEEGIVELYDILRERVAALKSDRERAKAAYDRARAQCGTVATIDAAKIDAFARLMSEKLDNGDTNARKGYIRSIVDAIEVDDKTIRIIAAGMSCKLPSQGNRSRTRMFVVLYANGAPDRIRTPAPDLSRDRCAHQKRQSRPGG